MSEREQSLRDVAEALDRTSRSRGKREVPKQLENKLATWPGWVRLLISILFVLPSARTQM